MFPCYFQGRNGHISLEMKLEQFPGNGLVASIRSWSFVIITVFPSSLLLTHIKVTTLAG